MTDVISAPPDAGPLAAARLRLMGTIRAGLQQGGGVDVETWRVSDYEPTEPVTPGIWIETPTIAAPTGIALVTASFPVRITVDGSDLAQMQWLDRLTVEVWQAIEGDPGWLATGAVPDETDLGGPRERAVVVTAQTDLDARTLCPPDLYP